MNKIMYKIILGLFTVLIISEGYLLRVRTAENINLVNENRELEPQLKNKYNYPFIGFFGSVNRTVSSYFFTLLPSAGNHAWFPAEFFLLAKLHDFISITKFDGQLL